MTALLCCAPLAPPAPSPIAALCVPGCIYAFWCACRGVRASMAWAFIRFACVFVPMQGAMYTFCMCMRVFEVEVGWYLMAPSGGNGAD